MNELVEAIMKDLSKFGAKALNYNFFLKEKVKNILLKLNCVKDMKKSLTEKMLILIAKKKSKD